MMRSPEREEVTSKQVADSVIKFKHTQEDRNSYLVDSTILLDAGVPVQVDPNKVILTHCHFDHVVYAAEIKERSGCQIISSQKTARHLKDMDDITLNEWFQGQEGRQKVKPIEVNRIVKEGEDVEGLEIIETPGHTDGGISLFEPERKILFTGDTWFGNGHGRTDLPTGSREDLKNSIEKLKSYNSSMICPGHGEIYKK